MRIYYIIFTLLISPGMEADACAWRAGPVEPRTANQFSMEQ